MQSSLRHFPTTLRGLMGSRQFSQSSLRLLASQSPSLSVQSVSNPTDGLTEEQATIYHVARDFAQKELAPRMQEWDAKEIFPVEALRSLASLGFGGIYVREENGGSGLKRIDASVVFEALAAGCVSTTAYLSIHK